MIIILGPPASGKGTQIRNLNILTGHPYFGAGEHLKVYSENYIDIKNAMNQGLMIETDEVNEFLIKKALSYGDNVILDGFPRSIKQLNFFLDFIKKEKKKHLLKGIFILDISNEEVKRRILKRHICQKCFLTHPNETMCCDNITEKRTDDINMEVINNRINNFYNHIDLIINIAEKNNIPIFKIDGTQSIDEISQDIINYL